MPTPQNKMTCLILISITFPHSSLSSHFFLLRKFTFLKLYSTTAFSCLYPLLCFLPETSYNSPVQSPYLQFIPLSLILGFIWGCQSRRLSDMDSPFHYFFLLFLNLKNDSDSERATVKCVLSPHNAVSVYHTQNIKHEILWTEGHVLTIVLKAYETSKYSFYGIF